MNRQDKTHSLSRYPLHHSLRYLVSLVIREQASTHYFNLELANFNFKLIVFLAALLKTSNLTLLAVGSLKRSVLKAPIVKPSLVLM